MGNRSRIVLACLALAWSTPALADTADLETGYRIAAEHVQKHAKDFWLDGTPQGEHALSRAWTLLADWTAAYLNEHPGATPKLLKRAAPGGDLDVVPLGPRTMLVSATVGDAFGTIFIVDGTSGLFRPVWSIRRRDGREAFPILDAWTPKAASGDCRAKASDADWPRCGSLGGTATRLADDAQGHPRFYVEAGYAEMMGNTQARQFSFWTWNGTTAEPQFATSYGTNIDDGGTWFRGDLVKIRLGEDYRAIPESWDHLDRALVWTFRAGPERIEDLGKKPLVPEVDVVDEVLFRAAHRQSADGFATPQVQEATDKIFRDLSADSEDGVPRLGMASSPVVRHQDGETLVCLAAVEPGTLTFKLTGAFVSGLSVTPDETGDGCQSNKP